MGQGENKKQKTGEQRVQSICSSNSIREKNVKEQRESRKTKKKTGKRQKKEEEMGRKRDDLPNEMEGGYSPCPGAGGRFHRGDGGASFCSPYPAAAAAAAAAAAKHREEMDLATRCLFSFLLFILFFISSLFLFFNLFSLRMKTKTNTENYK
jgi:hypothetical protein